MFYRRESFTPPDDDVLMSKSQNQPNSPLVNGLSDQNIEMTNCKLFSLDITSEMRFELTFQLLQLVLRYLRPD